ncbi:Striatin-interacting protein 1 [Choanephora cucurbitarum]|uniref:Striatin-interacting protein 1 n=1 Tax=Choanephora cucurbitarum TaxID=101091 RepID=A0A1C7NIP8_9FUNG|nr:Striatin-interacting protein 1 [Choanephora cucurbitarum]
MHTVHPEQIKNFYNSRKTNKVYQHADFDYFEEPSIEDELNEFISYHEIKSEFGQYESEYNQSFPLWHPSSRQQKQDIIQNCLDQLDLQNQHKRTRATQQLVYIALGNYGEYRGHVDEHRQSMKENSQLLYQLNTIPAIQQSLNAACQYIETPIELTQVNLYCHEIDMHLTILFLIALFNPLQEDEERLVECLLNLVVRLKEHFTKSFPLKKLMLTLHKMLSITLGPLDESMKSNMRSICHLPTEKHPVKLTPEELHHWYQQTQEKYHMFQPTPLPSSIANTLTATYSNQLTSAMGLSDATQKMDLPYQTLFPSKNNSTSVNPTQPTKRQQMATTNSFVQELPHSLTEANEVHLQHLYISLADYQLIHERERAVHRWEQSAENNDWCQLWDQLEPPYRQKMQKAEQLFSNLAPHVQSMVVVLLKLLLSTVSIGKDKEADILEDINITRNRESISKAASGILLLLLKWFKLSHVLKFEYLSQALVDSGCMLLILKLLGLQEIALLASKKTDDPSQSFIGFIAKMEPSLNEDDEDGKYTNKRNLTWSIHLLRILQMITKRKTHRILLLVQYKSSAILKRLLKVGHPTMDLYVLKNLKNQVPFMGRKWRSNNMKTISAIYATCLTYLNDEWLSLQEGLNHTEEGAAKEISLRALTRLYIGQHYLPQLMPTMDDTPSMYHESNGLSEDCSSDLIELDPNFIRDYRDWLQSDVYQTEEEEQEEQEAHSLAGTPLPDAMPKPISPDDLANEINKLYLEELEREFEKKKKQKEQEEMAHSDVDGWDQPVQVPVKQQQQEEEEEGDDVVEELDPLQDINWENLTEEDLKQRLTLVEEKTVQRWMNVDMDDPRYLKVVNPLETEIPLDEEGWPMW